MGKGKKRRPNQQPASKRPKLPKYWIEDFPELPLATSDISLYITRVNLSDAHHASLPIDDAAQVSNEESNVTHDSPFVVNDTVAAVALESMDSCGAEKQEIAEVPQYETFNDCNAKDSADEDTNTAAQIQIHSGESKQTNNASQIKDETNYDDLHRKFSVSIKRASFPPLMFNRDPKFRHKKNGDCGDGVVNPYPKTEVPDKYWAQRKRLFSRFSEGIQLDKESWYSVTPEVIANHIAERVVGAANKKEGLIVLEAFCGAAGNAIAFARRPEVTKVICVDTNFSRLKMAAHNCQVYEIPKDKIIFVHADACHVLQALACDKEEGTVTEEAPAVASIITGYDCCPISSLPANVDAIFLSPPWGGTKYVKLGPRQYNLSHIHLNGGIDGEDLLRLALKAFRSGQDKNIAVFLPRNLNGLSFAQNAFRCGLKGTIELEMDLIDCKFKAITAYIVQ